MRADVPPLLLQDLRSATAELTTCYWVQKRNGSYLRGTTHDQDVSLTSDDLDDPAIGTYRSAANITASQLKAASDGSVDNMEVQGALGILGALDVTVLDLESKQFDAAPVEILICNWKHPDHGFFIARRGWLGELTRDSDQNYTSELRGLKQPLTQVFIRTFSERCQVDRFGDAECGLDLTPLTVTGTVTAVTNRRRFDVDLGLDSPAPAAGHFNGGEFTFTTGANSGSMRELKQDDADDVVGHLSFWDAFPNSPQVGDEFSLTPGCDRLWATCKGYGNQLNFRGWGLLIPGVDALLRGPL